MTDESTLTAVTLEEAYRLINPRKRVLVVEDDCDVLSSLAEVIRDEGYDVATASNGRQALAQIEAEVPDLIFLDLMMPAMDGWGVVTELRRRLPTVQAPIVLLSAVRGLGQQAADLGIKYYLRKPFRLDDIVRIARECCAVPPLPNSDGVPGMVSESTFCSGRIK
jgi:CheY-like chemotaxis protein